MTCSTAANHGGRGGQRNLPHSGQEESGNGAAGTLAEIDRIGSATDFGGVPLFSQAANILAGHPRSRIKIMRLPCRLAAAETETLDVDQFYIGSKELLIDKTSFISVKKPTRPWVYLDAGSGGHQ